MGSLRDSWRRRRARTRWAIVCALLLLTAVVGAATVKATYHDPSVTIGAPVAQLKPPDASSCRRRGRRVLRLASGRASGTGYQTLLHSFQQACPVEAQRRSVTGFPLARCRTLAQAACTMFRKPPWTEAHDETAPAATIASGPAVDGDNVAALTTAPGSSGASRLAYDPTVPIDRRSPYVFTAYLKGAGAGEVSVSMYVVAVNDKGKALYIAVPLDPRVLGPSRGIRAPDLDGTVHLSGKWRRFGGFFPARTWGRTVRGVKITFGFSTPSSSSVSQVLVDAVQFAPGTEIEPFTRSREGNMLRDPSFELGGFVGA